MITTNNTKNAIILHKRVTKEEYYNPLQPSSSNLNWYPWLQKQLLINNIATDTPEVSLAYNPIWEHWVDEIKQFKINTETTLIGHSIGAGFWIRYLSEHTELNIDKLILIAPWIDVEQKDPNHFFNFVIDKNLINRTKEIIIFISDDDGNSIHSSVKKIQSEIKGVAIKGFHGYGHFTIDSMGTTEFPELLSTILE